MGRAQVLYNRRKGRGGGRNNNRDGRTTNNNNNNNTDSKTHRPLTKQHIPSGSLDDGGSGGHRRREKDYEEAYEVMFAGRDTALDGHGTDTEDDDETDDGHFVTGRICIPSMAAAFENLSMAKRLDLPVRVAAVAFPHLYRPSEEYGIDPRDSGAATEGKEEDFTEPTANTIASEAKEKDDRSKDPLDDWLDDACGIGDDDGSDQKNTMPNGPEETQKTSKLVTMSGAFQPSISVMPSADTAVNPTLLSPRENKIEATKPSNDALAKAAEEFGDDNLDDWLDSVI